MHGAAAACRRQRLGFTVSTRRTGDSESGNSDQNVKRRLRWGLALAAYAGISAYYRFRQQPPGIDGGPCRRFRVPAESIGFHHDTTWYEDDERQSVLQITDELIRLIEAARRFVVMDVFLFSLHHADRASDYLPTTRQIVDAFRVHERPAWFITDPINTSYGSWISPPLQWLEQAGVQVVVTNLRKLRDNNLLYSPAWRMFLQWIDTSLPPRFKNPLEPNATTTPWAILEAINARGNHRKLLIADNGDDYVSFITSSNFEDASSYFGNTSVTIRSAGVARQLLEAEKAVARMSGVEIPVEIPEAGEGEGDCEVTPLMGMDIKHALLGDLRRASRGDRLFLFAQFLSERELIEALARASRRGVSGVLVLDQNKVDFGNPKLGYPNQLTGPELASRTGFELRWANIRREEYHNQFMLLETPERCIFHVGSANYNRRSLSATVLETNVRIDAPLDSVLGRQVLDYAHWMASDPRSLPYEYGRRQTSPLKYWFYRFLEATGSGTF